MAKTLAFAVLLTAVFGCGPDDPDIVVGPLGELVPVHVEERYLYFTRGQDYYASDSDGLYRIARDRSAEPEELYSLPGLLRSLWTDGEVVLVGYDKDVGATNLVAVRLDGSVAWERTLPDLAITGLAWTDGSLLAITSEGAVLRLDAASELVLAQTGYVGGAALDAAAGHVYWGLKERPGIARLAIDGSESEPTLLTADFFEPPIDCGVTQTFLGIHDGEHLVASRLWCEDSSGEGNQPALEYLYRDGGIHTVVPEGETPRMLTDQILRGARHGDAVLGLNIHGDGVRLDLATGEVSYADQRADISSIGTMLATGDTLFYQRGNLPEFRTTRIEAIRFDR